MVPYCQTIHPPTHHTCTIPSYHITIIIKDPGGVVGLMLLRRGDLWATYQSLCLLYLRGLVMPPTMAPPYPPMWVLGTGLAPPREAVPNRQGGPGASQESSQHRPRRPDSRSNNNNHNQRTTEPKHIFCKGGAALILLALWWPFVGGPLVALWWPCGGPV